MAAIAKLATTGALIKDSGTGEVRINFLDGTELPFESATALTDFVANNQPTLDQVRAYLIANRLTNDPLLDSPALWDGKTLSFDLEQVNPQLVFRVL